MIWMDIITFLFGLALSREELPARADNAAQISLTVAAISRFRQMLHSDLESPKDERHFGKGWISGVIALALSITSLFLVIRLLYPTFFEPLSTLLNACAVDMTLSP
jgi:hypothetical protein